MACIFDSSFDGNWELLATRFGSRYQMLRTSDTPVFHRIKCVWCLATAVPSNTRFDLHGTQRDCLYETSSVSSSMGLFVRDPVTAVLPGTGFSHHGTRRECLYGTRLSRYYTVFFCTGSNHHGTQRNYFVLGAATTEFHVVAFCDHDGRLYHVL